MKIIYPDTPLIRSLSDRPDTWNDLYIPFLEKFSLPFKPIQSYYLFFEYIGFTKKQLEIPIDFVRPSFHGKENKEEISILDKNLRMIELGLSDYIAEKLYSLHPILEELKTERKKRMSSFDAAQELVDSLFGNIFFLMETNFDKFVQRATTYLAWDAFCSIHPLDIPLRAIRERQLICWFQRWEEGEKLPFGKIIDDQRDYNKIDLESHYKEREDMVDSEMHTYLALGYQIDNHIHPVHCLIYPPKDPHIITNRNELALESINNIQNTLRKVIPKFPGKMYSLDEKTHSIIEINLCL